MPLFLPAGETPGYALRSVDELGGGTAISISLAATTAARDRHAAMVLAAQDPWCAVVEDVCVCVGGGGGGGAEKKNPLMLE